MYEAALFIYYRPKNFKTPKNKGIDWLTTVLVTVTLFGVVLVLVAMMCSSKYQYQPTPAHKEITTYVGVTIFFFPTIFIVTRWMMVMVRDIMDGMAQEVFAFWGGTAVSLIRIRQKTVF